MSARPIASATISFGLVSVPVKLFSTAESSSRISFNWLNKDTGNRVKQQYVDPSNGAVVPRDEMVKGDDLLDGKRPMKYMSLRKIGDPCRPLGQYHVGKRFAGDRDIPDCRQDSRSRFQQSCLARPIRTGDCDEFTGVNFDIDVGQNSLTAESDTKV